MSQNIALNIIVYLLFKLYKVYLGWLCFKISFVNWTYVMSSPCETDDPVVNYIFLVNRELFFDYLGYYDFIL